MLVKESAARITLTECLEHPWFVEAEASPVMSEHVRDMVVARMKNHSLPKRLQQETLSFLVNNRD